MLSLKINKSGIIKIKLNDISSEIKYKSSCLKLIITNFKLQQHNLNSIQCNFNSVRYNFNAVQYNLKSVQNNLNLIQCNLNLVQYDLKSAQRKNILQLFIIFKNDYYFCQKLKNPAIILIFFRSFSLI